MTKFNYMITEMIPLVVRYTSYRVIRTQPGVEEHDLAKARKMLNLTLGDIADFDAIREEREELAYATASGNTGSHN